MNDIYYIDPPSVAKARAIHRVFVSPPPVTATKRVLGHTPGAAGAFEAIATALAIEAQAIWPTANPGRLDPEIDLGVVAHSLHPAVIRAAASNSFGFGGQNAVLIMRAP
jgi:3-oxoacyl-[acyl-carrier-protein] synthase II